MARKFKELSDAKSWRWQSRSRKKMVESTPISPKASARPTPRLPSFENMREEESQHRASLIDTYPRPLRRHPSGPQTRHQGLHTAPPILADAPLEISEVTKQAESWNWKRPGSTKARHQPGLTTPAFANCWGIWQPRSSVNTRCRPRLQENITADSGKSEDEAQRRLFVLQIVQPDWPA